MGLRTVIDEAKERYGIDQWGAGYFSIDKKGEVICYPDDSKTPIPLPAIVEKAKAIGIRTPMIIRFPQIVKSQLQKMHAAFSSSIAEFSYKGSHFGVFPFKVNQRREFIDTIVSCGREMNWGLEVGSKTEFMAALSYSIGDDALLVCNGFKDEEFIRLAFLAVEMKRKVVLVVEGPDELETIFKLYKEYGSTPSLCPHIGLRIRLYAKGSGKWEKSSGETSKFGLTTVELMHALRLFEREGLQNKLKMLHFHIGSQITAIKRFKNALREAARVYAKIVKLGFAPTHLNIGGGVGVDYDGSHTTAASSANYSLQEFANDAVYVVGEVCNNEEVPHPHIVTESGRVIAAYHSVVATDIREVQGSETLATLGGIDLNLSADKQKGIAELLYIEQNISPKNYSESYHDAVELHEDLFTLFNLGYITLQDRAIAEEVFHKICLKVLQFSAQQGRSSDDYAALRKLKVSKYLANFSIFQSIPDAWSIDHLFPVMPLSRHDEVPAHKATIVDITCDSDGCLDRFIDPKTERDTIDLHKPNGTPYYLGFFLVGAYQESLANEHNLFGAINEVEVYMTPGGTWQINKITEGDPIIELLVCRNYSFEELIGNYRKQMLSACERGLLHPDSKEVILAKLKKFLRSYPYLLEKSEGLV